MPLDGLSRSRGPVPQADALAVTKAELQNYKRASPNSPTPLQQIINVLDFNLLGVFSLKDIIQDVLLPDIDPLSQIPALLTTRLPAAIETSFDWQPALIVSPQTPPADCTAAASASSLIINTGAQLRLRADMRAPLDGSEATFTVDGSLSNVALHLANLIQVTFDQLNFHVERGKKVDFSTAGLAIQFICDLAFLNPLVQALPANGFSDPPAIDVTPDGVTAGYTLGIPSAGVGVFSLENINLSALLTLPFAGRCGLRLAFSDRYHNFLVTVSMIGGGGFLAIDVDTQGITSIEAALELGANITISLFIVSANAHVLAGFYFGWQSPKIAFSAFLRIGASVDLLGLISVSIDLYIDLGYSSDHSYIWGEASLTVSVHVLFVTQSFTLHAEKRFDVSSGSAPKAADARFAALAGASFDDLMDVLDWQTYCQAFA
jgi:hypothetical protein